MQIGQVDRDRVALDAAHRVSRSYRRGTWRSVDKAFRRDHREPRKADRATGRWACSRARRRTASRREDHFAMSNIFLESGSNRTWPGQDCHSRGGDEAEVCVRTSQRAYILEGRCCKLRAAIDTK